MIVASLLSLIIGLLIGFYGRAVYDKLVALYEQKRDEIEARQVGVVRPVGHRVTKGQDTDLSSETGPVSRPRPGVIEENRQIERARIKQDMHR